MVDTSRSPSRSPPRGGDRSPDRDRSGGRPRSGRSFGGDTERRGYRDRDAFSVFVGGLNFNTDESTLRDHFERFGEVESVRIIYDRETSRSKGIAFVHFSEKDAEDAIPAAVERTHGIEIDGRVLRCNPAADGPKAHQREPRSNDRAARGRHDDRGRGGRDRDDSRQPRGPPSGRRGRYSRSRSRSPPRGRDRRGRSRSRSDSPPPRRSSARRSDRKRSRSPGGKDEGGDASGDLSEARAHNAELEKRLAALEDAVARSKGSEDSQAARADALESALESAVERQRRRKGLVKKVVKAGAKATRCREELRDAEERLAGALREAQEAIEDAAGDEE